MEREIGRERGGREHARQRGPRESKAWTRPWILAKV